MILLCCWLMGQIVVVLFWICYKERISYYRYEGWGQPWQQYNHEIREIKILQEVRKINSVTTALDFRRVKFSLLLEFPSENWIVEKVEQIQQTVSMDNQWTQPQKNPSKPILNINQRQKEFDYVQYRMKCHKME